MIILDLSPFPKILKPGGHYLLVLLIIDLYSNSRFQNFQMQGYKDSPQDDWNGEFERDDFVKTVAIIIL